MTKPKHTGFDAPYLDEEEREMLEALESSLIVEDKPRAVALEEWRVVVRNTQRKKSITVRVQERDIARLKARAIQNGMLYQTLIASVLHQCAEGDLKENV